MYKIIGGDAREYGPVGADQIRQWIAEQRANGQTHARKEGEDDWRALADFPEFAGALSASTPEPLAPPRTESVEPPPPSPGPGSVATASSPTSAGRGVIDIGHCLGRGWALLVRNFALLGGATALVWLIVTAGAFATCLGTLLSFLLSGALYGGLTLVYLRRIRGQSAALSEVFCCFGPMFLQLAFVWMATHLASGVGMMLCLVPGLFLKVVWIFSLALVADRQMEFWPAMQTSWRVVLAQFVRVAGLLCVAWLPLIIIEAYSGFQSFNFVMERFGPVETWDVENLQDQMSDFTRFATKLELQKQLVFLLNLPLAMASILYAYEDLFGSRRSEAD